MIKEIIDEILQAELQAADMEKQAQRQAFEIGVTAQGYAEKMQEESVQTVKVEVRNLLKDAETEGEKQAAAVMTRSAAASDKAAQDAIKNKDKAAALITERFLGSF